MKAATVGLLLSFLGCVRAFQSLRSPLFARPSRQPPLIIQLRSTLETRSINPTVEEEEEEAGVGAWIPIASRHALRGLGPQQIRVMGVDFVVWEHNETWSVMADTCPHRLAPLSQGRVDPDTGSIACPYHGWQFNAQGTLTKLPQADPNLDITKIAGTSALCFPTHVAGDMIFAFLPSSMHGEMFLQSTLPEVMFPTLREEMKLNKSYFVRELPYSADFCIENFMDPSHIPFAHHSLQGSRSDATPIPTEVTVSNFTHIETSFQDVVRGNRRIGIASFQRPTMYHFRVKDNNSSSYRTGLNIHIVPVEAGKTRVFFASMFLDLIPDWLRHAASNRFLNTDAWLHNAEIQTRIRSSKFTPYVYATEADTSVRAFRQWWSRHGFSTSPPNTFGPAAADALILLDRRQQIDPWQHHSRQCASCRKALKLFQRIQFGGLLSAFLCTLLLRQRPMLATIAVAASLFVRHFAISLRTIIEGNPHPSGYSDRSVAQNDD